MKGDISELGFSGMYDKLTTPECTLVLQRDSVKVNRALQQQLVHFLHYSLERL
jgi:hypothetical protein